MDETMVLAGTPPASRSRRDPWKLSPIPPLSPPLLLFHPHPPPAFSRLTKKVIDWNDQGLTSVPKSLQHVLDSEVLEARRNRLEFLNVRLKTLTNLVWVDLRHNSFQTVPVAILGLPRLQHLDLSHNKLVHAECTCPAWLGSIETVLLDHNCLTGLPGWFINAPRLTLLSLNHNCMNFEIPSLTQRFFILSGYKSIAPLQSNLKALNLQNCGLTSLPLGLRLMKKITHLNLGNEDTSVSKCGENVNSSPEIGFALSSTLEVLDLRNLGLWKLPDKLDHLTSLRIIILRGNFFSFLPESFTQMDALEWVDLSKCCLTDLPLAMGKLWRLRCLKLSRNKVSFLPASMSDLENLEILDLYQNCLDHFPSQLFSLPKLKKLDCEMNFFSTTQDAEFSSKYNELLENYRKSCVENRLVGPAVDKKPFEKFGSQSDENECYIGAAFSFESDFDDESYKGRYEVACADEMWDSSSDESDFKFNPKLCTAGRIERTDDLWVNKEEFRTLPKLDLPSEPGQFDDASFSSGEDD
ncbi:leucine-rich repeat protein SHOC-2-like [Neocloeon triangulifer]|uniref:leucine-rich repeat protein SHOC-2-like n=1 Tax=Neocloeon triangulifer TaxID=2078957 RepID=UPI00286F5321|nr:leucine-rich repeat protein SHOC-2-like [Neocloeon triangulifer]XP_059469498.1 leucine-rich repeat protein SHOC-2-like [Neocloeon triangulifer]XP_059469499.1 leucine-rich repeat protein SHOC-2-like [Neocloeon triangulifer]